MIITDQKLLRVKSEPVTTDDYIDTMVQQLKDANDTAWVEGCGLAGIQIGIKKRIAWLRTPSDEEIILVNPKILKTVGNTIEEEGCLSIPDNYVRVMRAEKIFVTFDTLRENDRVFEVDGYPARVIQHEIDHMNGILNIDKVHYGKSVGRNMPCPCGSGKKFKKCCLN